MEESMKRSKIIGLIAVLMLIAAACSSGDSGDTTTTAASGETTTTAASGETTTTAASGETTTTAASSGGVEDYGESTDADPALVDKALGVPVADVNEIVLASIARASQDLDQATIDKAMECWSQPDCETGTGGEITMGYADGGGLNVWRQVTHMEAILQALTYPEIGKIISTDAQWNVDPAVAAGDIRFLIQAGVDFIVGYPDQGIAIADAILEAEAAGISYIPYSAGYVGLPGQDGALEPGVDYTSIVGEDLCQLGTSFATIMNEQVGTGTIGILGGTPGNALSLGWQTCEMDALNDTIDVLGPADTYWVNSIALETVTGWLSTNPDIAGYSYEYADGLYTSLDAYEQLGIPVDNLVVTVRTDEQTLFCDWAERDNPNYQIWYSAGGNFQSRVAVTASMMYLKGAEIPPEILVPHVMRLVTADDCNPNRVTPTVSNTSLVPDAVLVVMYPAG
jgi:ABC-type sugar transport system substrate-binding protein